MVAILTSFDYHMAITKPYLHRNNVLFFPTNMNRSSYFLLISTSLFLFPKSQIVGLLDFVNLIMKTGHWKQSICSPHRKGRKRQGELDQFLTWQLNGFYQLFFWWMGTFLNFSSPFHPGEMSFEYLFYIKVHKRWLSKVHDCPLKCTNVLLKKRSSKWELYGHAYSWNAAQF